MCILLKAYWKCRRMAGWFPFVHPAVDMGKDPERLGRYDLAKSVPNLICSHIPVTFLFLLAI